MATVAETTNPRGISADEALYEIVRGQRVELPPMSIFAVRIGYELGRYLGNYAEAQDRGWAVTEGLFVINAQEDTDRRPDVAFVSYERWPKDRPIPEEDNAWDVMPDLVAEVVSPTDRAEELLEKLEEYFTAGVRLVWGVYPRRRIVHVYESLMQIRGLSRSDELDGGAVLPGFRLPLANLFPEKQAGS